MQFGGGDDMIMVKNLCAYKQDTILKFKSQ